MAKRTVNISGTVGAQEIPADRTAWVNIRSEYTFDDGSTRNFAVPQTVSIVNGQAQVDLEPVVDGVRAPWRFEFVFADRQEKVQSIITEVRRFPADGLTTAIDYNALEFTEPENPNYGPTYLEQTKEARDEALQARDDAAAFGGTNNAQVAGMVTGDGPTKTALAATIATLVQWAKNPDAIIVGAITRNTDDIITSAAVVWPDGTPGTFTTDTIDPSNAINAYHVTYGSPATKTFTQPAMTRNANGAVTALPTIVVS